MDYRSWRWRFVESLLIDCQKAKKAIFDENKKGFKFGISKNRK